MICWRFVGRVSDNFYRIYFLLLFINSFVTQFDCMKGKIFSYEKKICFNSHTELKLKNYLAAILKMYWIVCMRATHKTVFWWGCIGEIFGLFYCFLLLLLNFVRSMFCNSLLVLAYACMYGTALVSYMRCVRILENLKTKKNFFFILIFCYFSWGIFFPIFNQKWIYWQSMLLLAESSALFLCYNKKTIFVQNVVKVIFFMHFLIHFIDNLQNVSEEVWW